MQHLHQVRGRLEIALDLIDRAAVGLVACGADGRVLDELFEATKALAVATARIDRELQPQDLGPAA